MIVMPANATGWFWHILARETGKLGHLYSPDCQNGPWPWLPYACDNGAFSCWNQDSNTFDHSEWGKTLPRWKELMLWCAVAPIKPRWALVPDVPGNAIETLARWPEYLAEVVKWGHPTALAVQDGMTPAMVRALAVQPDVIFVGGSTDWKWSTVENWCKEFPRVHVGRVNSPRRLYEIEAYGVESCDGTGWNRGDRKQTSGLEEWCRARAEPTTERLWPLVCTGLSGNTKTVKKNFYHEHLL